MEAQLSIDYLKQSLTAPRKIIQTTTPYEQRDELSEVETTFIPLTFNLQYNIPLSQKITTIVGSGFGLGFLNEKVTPINPDYSHSYDTFDSYAGLSTAAWTGFKYTITSNFQLLSKLIYRYSKMKSEINLQPHGFIDSIREINGFLMNIGIEYSF
ncbi:MAG: hypothetical protein K0B81_01310 [Candidatus Cloacimonetes bacterium]|nr:hypothetical protein [Candidatus Cloacimonadota bacterium]